MTKKKRLKTLGKVTTFNAQKGGVGKTTIAYHYACYTAANGYRTVVIDLDGQGNLSGRFFPVADTRVNGYRSVHMFDAEARDFLPLESAVGVDVVYALNRDVALFDIEQMPLGEAVTFFNKKLEALREEYDVIIIDTPPSHGNKITAACVAADHLFVPVELAAFAVEGVENVLETLQEISRLINFEIKATGVICNKLRAVNSHEHALADLRAAVGPLILKQCLVNRGSVDDALRDGVPVWDKKSTGAQRDAGKEMRSLMKEIAGLTNLKVDGKAGVRK